MNVMVISLLLGVLLGQSGPADRFPGDQFAAAPLGEVSSLQDWIARHPDAEAEEIRSAWVALCDAEARVGRYRQAREACQAAADLRATPGLSQSIALWATLSETPPISVQGTVDVPLTKGFADMAEVVVTIKNRSSGWIVDTGAEFSLLSVSDARRLGVRMLDGDYIVAGSTPGAAAERLGVIDALSIGDAVVSHVPVLVMPDARLTIPGKGRIPPLLGMPVLYAFARVGFTDDATRLNLGDTEPLTAGAPMRWSVSGIDLELRMGEDNVILHLDSGASQSELLASDVLPIVPDSLRERASERVFLIAGVTGTVRSTVTTIENLPLELGDRVCGIPEALFGEDAAGVQGRLGIDFIRGCGELRLDFTTMRAAAGPISP